MNMHSPAIEILPVAALRPYAGYARTHSKRQVNQIVDSIRRFGFTNPVLISDDAEIIAGHGRVMAARQLNMPTVPVLRLSHLSPAERRAYGAQCRLGHGDPGHRIAGSHRSRLRCLAHQLVGEASVDLVFTDPPYNVPIDGHVGGLGSVRHREFAFASGVMSSDVFTAFLTTTLGNAAACTRDGAIAFVCMDWRHMRELLDAGEAVFSELKNLCVWNKTNGGMGSFYRSKHELVFVFKVGTAPHTNTFGLGDTGRYRTNVWTYPGISSLGANRSDELSMHPTVKPVALVADAIRDCSRRGEIVLDVFGGSGTTMIAAELCGRQARLIEFDPLYCDTIVQRWQRYTGKTATLAESGQDFDITAEQRLGRQAVPGPAQKPASKTGKRRSRNDG